MHTQLHRYTTLLHETAPYKHVGEGARGTNGIIQAGSRHTADRAPATLPEGRLKTRVNARLGAARVEAAREWKFHGSAVGPGRLRHRYDCVGGCRKKSLGSALIHQRYTLHNTKAATCCIGMHTHTEWPGYLYRASVWKVGDCLPKVSPALYRVQTNLLAEAGGTMVLSILKSRQFRAPRYTMALPSGHATISQLQF